MTLTTPFPYFGKKTRIANIIWEALGDPVTYVEPFCGTAAVLLARPRPGKYETINDLDGFVANFWRAVKADPGQVTDHFDYPPIEIELRVRHNRIEAQYGDLLESLRADPDFYDPKIAGWWAWGSLNTLRGGWWAGASMSLDVHVRMGADRIRIPPEFTTRREFISDWIARLSERLRNVRVTCRDWSRALRPPVLRTAYGTVGIFLDPPYARRDPNCYKESDDNFADALREWCLQNGSNPRHRIVLCGNVGEHAVLEGHGWRSRVIKRPPGFGTFAKNGPKESSTHEEIWLSPYALEIASTQRSPARSPNRPTLA